jgi:hypothetical protein
MKKNSIESNKYVFMSSFLLPEGMLDFFEIERIEEEPLPDEPVYRGGILHIYLDELDNRLPEQGSLRPNGFTEPIFINDFPIRDRKVVLHVRRRRWLDTSGHNVVLNVYDLTTKGTRYSEEFAAFLKERLGYLPSDGTFAGVVLQD